MNPYQKLLSRKRTWTPVQTTAGKLVEGAEEAIYRALAIRHMELPVGDFITDALDNDVPTLAREVLQSNVQDEIKHDLALGYITNAIGVDQSAEEEAIKLRDAWVAHLKEVGIFDCFDACLFSSDSRSMKPSPQLYNQALWRLQATCESSLFVGDSLRCDMEGAKNVGLTTVWITQREDHQDSVDYRVPSLLQLEELEI